MRLGQNGLTSGGASLPTTINTDKIPEEFADTYLIRPQTLASLDLKLRDALLSLMERREYFKNKMERARRDSGVHLVETLLEEQALVDSSHCSNAAIIDAKLRLEELRFETLSSTHPSSFTALRDELANLLLELPEAERWSPSAIYDFYMRLLASLGDKSIGFAVRSSLTQQQMNDYDHESLADSIVRRLSELFVEEKHRAHINQRDGRRASPAAAFLATDADNSKINKDPTKNARPSCAVCGKTGHTENQCFHNQLASCPKAISRAPIGTPLYHKHNPSSQLPSPRNSNRHKPAKPSSASAARALAASCSRPTEHEVEQALADTLGRCGLLADDHDGRVLMALAASPPTHRPAHTHAVTISNSPLLMKSNAAPRGILADFTNSNLYSLLRPSTERAVDAARQLLYLAALPSEVACGALSKATSLGERIQGGLRSLFSRRDTPLDDDISSTAPNPKQALPSPTPAHALAASAADSARHQGMESPSSTAHGSAITLAVDSGCTWHLHHRRD